MQDFDLMKYVDNFKKTEHIKSVLVFGDPSLCPNPFISIVIPTYKRPELLKIAIQSALNQVNFICTYEIVVVDNEYSDNAITKTHELMLEFSKFNVLYYQNIKNIGMVGNWNRCISLSLGCWVSFLHDDDALAPHYLNRIEQLVTSKDRIGGISVGFHTIKDNDDIDHIIKDRLSLYSRRLFDRLCRGKLMRQYQLDSILLTYCTYSAPTCGSIFLRTLML